MTSVDTSWPSDDSATCAKSETEVTLTINNMTNMSIWIRMHLIVSLGICKNRYSTSGT